MNTKGSKGLAQKPAQCEMDREIVCTHITKYQKESGEAVEAAEKLSDKLFAAAYFVYIRMAEFPSLPIPNSSN